jgi:hypothetical protein
MTLSNHDYLRAVLQELLPPGGVSSDQASLIGYLCNALAKALEYGQDAADQLALEVFPHTAQECLDEWAKLFRHAHPPNAAEAEKQAALMGRWLAGAYPTVRGIRQALSPMLNSTIGFGDDCDDSDVSVRYEAYSVNGATSEDSTKLRIEALAAQDCRWDGTNENPEALFIDLANREAAFEVQALISAYSVGTDCRAGVVVWENIFDAVYFGLHDVSGTLRLRCGRIEDGVVYGPAETIAVPATPFWIQIRHNGGEYSFGYGASLGSLTTAATTYSGLTIKPRKVGWYAANDATNLGQMDLDTTQIQYDDPEHNVEVIEHLAGWGGDENHVFSIFVHRDPTTGTYDIGAAQNIADRIKHAHTLITVGESDCFRVDDSYSLTDRDVLGQ